MSYIDTDRHLYGSFELKFLSVDCASSNDKLVYLYMRHQYNYFVGMGNNTYFESLESIAKAVGMSRATVVRCINKLEEIKWLTKSTTRNKIGHNQTIYTIQDWDKER